MIICEGCELWFHPECMNLTKTKEHELQNVYFYCIHCTKDMDILFLQSIKEVEQILDDSQVKKPKLNP